ncbi:MAG: ABC transporter ATP-binding protein [Xanthomonadales bacterium]|nr:ABC transporter ATP-binding protein [Xanthomonadales bacterium]
MADLTLLIEGVHCRYGQTEVVHGVDLQLEAGELHCLLGPSGCGKTTLLRAVAGFVAPAAGTIRLRGRVVADAGFQVRPEQRRIGWVTQDLALFPHLDVAANVGFGLGRNASDRATTVDRWLDRVGLAGLAKRMPHELSGGQQQRVALARAMAPGPDLVLLDEPFSSLDRQLREDMVLRFRDLLQGQGTTALMVTHHQDEAFVFGDRVSVMGAGRIEQSATPRQLVRAPATAFVADFVGMGTWFRRCRQDDGHIQTPLGQVEAPGSAAYWDVMVRPEQIGLEPEGVPGEVRTTIQRDTGLLTEIRLESGESVRAVCGEAHRPGDSIRIGLVTKRLIAFPSDRPEAP